MWLGGTHFQPQLPTPQADKYLPSDEAPRARQPAFTPRSLLVTPAGPVATGLATGLASTPGREDHFEGRAITPAREDTPARQTTSGREEHSENRETTPTRDPPPRVDPPTGKEGASAREDHRLEPHNIVPHNLEPHNPSRREDHSEAREDAAATQGPSVGVGEGEEEEPVAAVEGG